MILIADSGSTKTDWCLTTEEGKESHLFTTQGINPYHQSEQEITDALHDMKGLLPTEKIEAVYFYGAGCTAEKSPVVCKALQKTFPHVPVVEAASDMLGAARSLCGHRPGIVCIIGTGSNSCYYDGKCITHNTPPLGYILGDEGSGAALGKRLVSDCLKRQLPEETCKQFSTYCGLSLSEIIDRVYRRPMPNRFLAECSRFLHEHRKEESIHQLLTSCFADFFRRNVLAYPKGELFFTGSIACYYAEELKEAATTFHLQIASIRQRPIEGLITFHTKRKEA